MKIFYDHQIFCNQNYGGPSRYFVSLAEKLKDKNLDIKISAPLHINEYLNNLDKKIIFGIFQRPTRLKVKYLNLIVKLINYI